MGPQSQPAQQQNGGLLDLMSGGTAQPQQTVQQPGAGGGLLSALFNILGDNG